MNLFLHLLPSDINYQSNLVTHPFKTTPSLFAQDRESILEAFPGDVIGIHNPGHFAIGDTIYTGSKRITYPGIPSFSPEKFAYLRNPNPGLYKKFQKGLSELLDEGSIQLFYFKSFPSHFIHSYHPIFDLIHPFIYSYPILFFSI